MRMSATVSAALRSNAAMNPVNRLATAISSETDNATAITLRRMIRRLRTYLSQRNSFSIGLPAGKARSQERQAAARYTFISRRYSVEISRLLEYLFANRL